MKQRFTMSRDLKRMLTEAKFGEEAATMIFRAYQAGVLEACAISSEMLQDLGREFERF